MARKTELVTIDTPGRDHGKTFVITEMSADRGARWAYRALLALTNVGASIPDEMLHAGFAGVAAMQAIIPDLFRALGKLEFDRAEPLLAELLGCVQYQPPGLPKQALMAGELCQIEEIATFPLLHWRTLSLHVDFSEAVSTPT